MGLEPKYYREINTGTYTEKLTLWSFIKQVFGAIYLFFLFGVVPILIIIGLWYFTLEV